MSLFRAWSLSVALALVGCGGDALDLGSTEGGAGPVWNGTIDGVQLQDGSNRLTMTLDRTPDGRATGTLLLGGGALLQSPRDPDIGFPPGAMFPVVSGSLGFFEGFRYPMTDGGVAGSKLTFRLAELDLWARWCSLQTKTYLWPGLTTVDGGVLYACGPPVGIGIGPACSYSDPATGNEIPVDCGKAELCSMASPCDCSATGCAEKITSRQLYIDFDLVLSGSHADGTISGALGDHAVHFVRAP